MWYAKMYFSEKKEVFQFNRETSETQEIFSLNLNTGGTKH